MQVPRIGSRRTLRFATIGLAVVGLSGCGGSNGRVEPPTYSADAGTAACAAYDTNRDGAISGAELDRVPSLKAAIQQMDVNRDSRITADEIDARLLSWRDSRIGEMPVRCHVTLDGVPLADAQITFEPEAFLGPQVHPAAGTTAANGIAGISMAAEHLADAKYAGVACGFYKIRVTSSSRDIPARYNTETILGCEVAMDAHWVSAAEVSIELKSKLD